MPLLHPLLTRLARPRQSCPPNDANPDRHECKLSEATTNLSGLGRLVVTFNWVSFISFLFSEVVYFRREAFLISHFVRAFGGLRAWRSNALLGSPSQDDNDAAPYNQLPTFITRDEHGHMLEGLRSHNKVARVSALGMLILCSCNLFFSCCLLLTPPARGGRYNGTRTLVTLVSNTLLLARRVVQNARISNLSTREDLALSLYQMKARRRTNAHCSPRLRGCTSLLAALSHWARCSAVSLLQRLSFQAQGCRRSRGKRGG